MDEVLVAQTLQQRQLAQEAQRARALGVLHDELEEGLAVQRPHCDVGLGHNGRGTGLWARMRAST